MAYRKGWTRRQDIQEAGRILGECQAGDFTQEDAMRPGT